MSGRSFTRFTPSLAKMQREAEHALRVECSMPLPTPDLDDRRFQDIVDEAKGRITRYCPEWTDHNVSDPGITLIELFAWMVDMLLFRVNRVPEKSYITFMQLMGVQLQPPSSARADLTFWLGDAATTDVPIASGTEVSTLRKGSEESITFSTDADVVVYPPSLAACLTSSDERTFASHPYNINNAVTPTPFQAFSQPPKPGDSFYLGFKEDISGHILALTVDCAAVEGIGIKPEAPPLAWECRCGDSWVAASKAVDDRVALNKVGDRWEELTRLGDGTGGLNRKGLVRLHLPYGMTLASLDSQEYYWLRCRYAPLGKEGSYEKSPRITSIQAAALGISTPATHSTRIRGEVLGRSAGTPGQSFHLEYTPILPRQAHETIEVQAENGKWDVWEEQEHLGTSRPRDRHFVLDAVSGEVCFGPAIREPDGSERQYGAIPPKDGLIRFTTYRTGGGSKGNVAEGTITVLKQAIPYVDRVTNRAAASDGYDAESLEHAAWRAPQMLRTSARAVTAEDYEYLATEAAPGIRSRCVRPTAVGAPGTPPPGTVQLLLVPAIKYNEGSTSLEQLEPSAALVDQVQSYLDERRPIGTLLTIGKPEYRQVAVEARLKAQAKADEEAVRREAAARLYRFLHPTVGGSDGTGWPFGRHLYVSEIYARLQTVPGVEYVEQVTLRVDGREQTQVSVPANGLLASAEHRIEIV